MSQRRWVLPKAGGGDSLLGMGRGCLGWQVALLMVTGHTVLGHCRRLGETQVAKFRLENRLQTVLLIQA